MQGFVLTTLCLAFGMSAQAQSPLTVHDTIQVTGSHLDGDKTPARRRIVLTREDIAALPVHSLQDLILYLAGSGVSRRGANGIQADTMLRGATFEGVSVLVNGVRMNDPQTGHFHLDIPLPIETIERVEVLLGPGSATHGPDAFGGVIQVTTRSPQKASTRLALGQHDLTEASLTVPLGAGFFSSLERAASKGFRPETEYSISRGLLGWSGVAGAWDIATQAASESKDFGAWAFYSSRFPNERERTGTDLFTARASRPIGSLELTLLAGARQHRDLFWLDRTRPSWYENRHRTRSGNTSATLRGQQGKFSWAAGVEAERQLIHSSNLGNHDRNRQAVFAETAWQSGRWRLSAQGRGDHMDSLGWRFSPGLGIEADLGRGFTIAAHRGRSFRLPSFTDLYYTSPSSLGNPSLHPEQAWSDEITLAAPVGAAVIELAAFRRQATNLIDFVRDDAGVYRAANHAKVDTTGAEVAMSLGAVGMIRRARLSIAWLDSRVDVDPTRSRYALAHPRWEAAFTTSFALPARITADLAARVRKPQSRGSYTVVDLRLARGIGRGVGLELEGSNLLNRSYQEMDQAPMPGRWVSLALTWRPNVT